MKKTITLLGKVLISLIFFLPFSNHAFAAVLSVTSIVAEKTEAVDDNTYDNGWRWIFSITLPENENLVQMRFADFFNGSSSIPVGNNMRLFSIHSINSPDSASAKIITGSGIYSDNLVINTSTDLDPVVDGIQIKIVVEMKVPVGTVGKGYTTNYGISSSAPKNKEDSLVNYKENSIVSGVCLTINNDNWISGSGHISQGVVHKYGKNHNFPGLNINRISESLLNEGLQWLIYINASTTNGYSATLYPEQRDPETLANLLLVGMITYNNLGEIVGMVSQNSSCDPITVTPVEEIQSGMCLVPVDNKKFKVTDGTVFFDDVLRNFPEKELHIDPNIISQSGFNWTAYTNYSSSVDKFNIHFTEGLQNIIFGPNPKEVNIGHVQYNKDGTLMSLKSKNPMCQSYSSSEGGGIPVPSGDVVNTRPIVTLVDPSEITIKVGEGYGDFHFTAIDAEDGDLLDSLNLDHIIWSGNVDIWTPGEYTRTVTAIDSGGLSSDPVSQTIHVVPLTPIEQAWKDLRIIWGGYTDYITTKITIGDASGQYTQSNVDLILGVLDSTKTILDNPSSTVDELTTSFITLNNAFNSFTLSINP